MNKPDPNAANALVPHRLDLFDLADIEEPEDQVLLHTFIDEASFFWKFLRPFLIQLKPSEVAEVGSGVGLLSLFASSEVKEITSIEPESLGFGQMRRFRAQIVDKWRGEGMPVFEDSFLHNLPTEAKFDFIYSINVLEHVPSPEKLLDEVFERLKPGGTAWFVLPNYSFPYEQHFEIPIFFSKRFTAKVFGARIQNSSVSSDPIGLWAELSWPTQIGLKNFFIARNWSYEFKRTVLEGYFERLGDPHFIRRKGSLYKFFLPVILCLRPIVMALPFGVSPIIEFTISKPFAEQSKLSVRNS